MKYYYVEYSINGEVKRTKRNSNFILVMREQADILIKYKNKGLDYAIYKEEVE